MTGITPSSVFRNYNTDGVPASGVYQPQKSEIRRLLEGGLLKSPKWYGAVSDGVTDDSAAITDALNEQKIVVLPQSSITAIASTINIPADCGLLSWDAQGGYKRGTQLKWIGASGGKMVNIPSQAHNTRVEGLYFNANNLAKTCVHVNVAAAESIQGCLIRNLEFALYGKRPMIVGLDSLVTPINAQIETLRMEHIRWSGPMASLLPDDVIGLLYNAGGTTHASADDLLFDPVGLPIEQRPDPDIVTRHDYHIFVRKGCAFFIDHMTTARAALASVYMADPLMISGWYSEDRYLIRTANANFNGPSSFRDLYHASGYTLQGDTAIIWDARSGPNGNSVSFENCAIMGDVVFGNTDQAARAIAGSGFTFIEFLTDPDARPLGRIKFPNGIGYSNPTITTPDGIIQSLYAKASLGPGLDADVIVEKPLDANEHEDVEVIIDDNNTCAGKVILMFYRGTTSVISMTKQVAVTEVYNTTTYGFTDNTDGTYSLNIDNGDGSHTLAYQLRFLSRTIRT